MSFEFKHPSKYKKSNINIDKAIVYPDRELDKEGIMKLASETGAEEFELDLQTGLLKEFEEWKKNNSGSFRDFLNTKDIISAINTLRKKKAGGVYNIGSGICFDLRNIAKIFARKYNKGIIFQSSSKPSFLISNNNKIKKLGWIPSKFNNNTQYFYK